MATAPSRTLLSNGIRGDYAAALAASKLPTPDDALNKALQTGLAGSAASAPVPASAPAAVPRPVAAPAPAPVNTAPRAPAPNVAAPPTNAPAPPPTTAAQPPNGDAGYYTDWGGGNVAQQQHQLADVRAGQGAPMQGFQQGKVADDTLGSSNKYTGGRILAAGGSIADVLHDPQFAGWTQVGPDKIKGPGGSVYDVRNANGAVQWTAISGPAWDKNGIAGVNSLGVSSSLAKDGIKGNYAAANAAASDAAGAAGTSRFGYAGAGGAGAAAPAAPAGGAGDFDEAAYLAANPDVAKAVQEGWMPSGKFHYDAWGKTDGRLLKPAAAAAPAAPAAPAPPAAGLPRDTSSQRVTDMMDNGNPYGAENQRDNLWRGGDRFGAWGKVGRGETGQQPQSLTDPHVNEAIMRLLARGEKGVTREDVEEQYSPVAAVIQRNAQRQKAAAAERAAFQGTNIGGAGGSNDARAQQIDEASGMQQGQLMSQLIGSEITQRRGDVVSALQNAQGEQKLALERQLGLIDAELRRMGYEQQNQQFYDDFGLRVGQGEYDRSANFNAGLT